MELFDYKPLLRQREGEDLPESIRQGQRLTGMTSYYKAFPLKGTYQFNFRIKYNRQFIYILQDKKGSNTSLDQSVTNAENKIVIKANRISWIGNQQDNSPQQRYLLYKFKIN